MKTSWLTRPLFTCPTRLAKILKVGLLLAIVLVIISPMLVTFAWHMGHGYTIECGGTSVHVPLRWTAYIGDGNDAMLTKLPFVIPLKPGTGLVESWISIGHSLSPRRQSIEDQYKTFESVFWNLHADLGEVVSGPVRMGSGPQEVFCMQGADPRSARSSASCLLLGGKWRADFMGNKGDMKDLFTIIQNLH